MFTVHFPPVSRNLRVMVIPPEAGEGCMLVLMEEKNGKFSPAEWSTYTAEDAWTHAGSIETGPEYLGDHSCTHHKYSADCTISKTSNGIDGYAFGPFITDIVQKLYSVADPDDWIRYTPSGSREDGGLTWHMYQTWTSGTYSCSSEQTDVWADGDARIIKCHSEIRWDDARQEFWRDSYQDIIPNWSQPSHYEWHKWVSYSMMSYLDISYSGYSGATYDQSRWDALLRECGEFAPPLIEKESLGPYKASYEAAMGFNAYDLNLIEAIAGFSIDDLVPKGLAKSYGKALKSALASKSIFGSMIKATQLSAATYLYGKYVTGNNIADVEQLLNIRPDHVLPDIWDLVVQSSGLFGSSDETHEHYNDRLALMARKIVYRYDFHQDTYGGHSEHVSNAYATVTRTDRAGLHATPGPLRDMTTCGIILDDIGLSLRASRVAQAVKWEFVANWFIPIEDMLDTIEFNSDRLNQLFKVQRLVLSTKTVTNYNFDSLKYLYGLSDAQGHVTVVEYHRHTTDKFPPTSFQFTPLKGPSTSRVLQGGALLITNLH